KTHFCILPSRSSACPPNVCSLSFAWKQCVTRSIDRNECASWTEQWHVMSGSFGPLLAVRRAMSPPFLGAISACTGTRCCMCSVQVSEGSVSVVFLSGSRVCPQTIGKTTKEKLNGDVTTTFPPLVLSSS
ncbi:unnamed protein product, partial [Ectocarpus sp. 13 AM-2016]